MRVTTDWVGRRWFEMRIGYGTYMAFIFGFANFVLLLHGLTDWFKDYPVIWFAVGMMAVIVPVSILVGHRHNRTQQKIEARNLTHLNPYINTIVPNSKEVFHELYLHMWVDLMILSTRHPEMKDELVKIKAALVRYRGGEAATDALDREGVRSPDSHTVPGAGTPGGGRRWDGPAAPGAPGKETSGAAAPGEPGKETSGAAAPGEPGRDGSAAQDTR